MFAWQVNPLFAAQAGSLTKLNFLRIQLGQTTTTGRDGVPTYLSGRNPNLLVGTESQPTCRDGVDGVSTYLSGRNRNLPLNSDWNDLTVAPRFYLVRKLLWLMTNIVTLRARAHCELLRHHLRRFPARMMTACAAHFHIVAAVRRVMGANHTDDFPRTLVIRIAQL